MALVVVADGGVGGGLWADANIDKRTQHKRREEECLSDIERE